MSSRRIVTRQPVPLVTAIASSRQLSWRPIGLACKGPCTSAPPRPANLPIRDADWNAAVHDGCFANIQRLNRWFGRTAPLEPKQSPAPFFIPVGESGITSGSVVVLVHGWAPGFRAAVDQAGGRLLWWQDGATNADGVWTSDWAWVPSTGTVQPPLPITETGVFQEVIAHNSDAIVLGYSWIDNSATQESSYVELDLVFRSEAYTNVNGLRLANALEEALAPEFWTGSGNRLHLVGHSHGSKVVTVATLALQGRGKRVDQLTTLDSPERESTLAVNGANLLGFYLNQIATGDGSSSSGPFVDNYVSNFGAAFKGTANADRVVDVVLNPEVYGCLDQGDRHSYSAEWYGGAAAGASKLNLPPVGLDWPPPPDPSQPALNQTWPDGITEKQQWQLSAGESGSIGCAFSAKACTYTTATATVNDTITTGNVTGSLPNRHFLAAPSRVRSPTVTRCRARCSPTSSIPGALRSVP